MIDRILWLAYRRLRPALGTSFGFVLMYAALAQTLSYPMFFIALGFMMIHLFSDCFNDYYDIEIDRRNKRQDKITLSGIISPKIMYSLSIIFLASGISMIILAGKFLILPALWCAFLSFSYSHPGIRLKNHNLAAYLLGGSVWIPTFFLLEQRLFGSISAFGLIFTAFCFSQFVFILCQKDATDKKDDTNLFLSKGRDKSFLITAFFGMVSSASLLLLSVTSIFFSFLWALNSLSKAVLLDKIRRGTITRAARSNLVLIEFLTPYLFILGSIL